MSHWVTNISDIKRISVYEEAIQETGVNLWIGEANGLAPNDQWKGLWGPAPTDLSKFWDAVRRIDSDGETK